MKLTVEQALKRGVEAQSIGKLQDAERIYRSILQALPKHPDANHNLGVLANSLKKFELALPFLKTAVESNPNAEQFWFSYIEALIELKQFENAKTITKQAANYAKNNKERLSKLEAEIADQSKSKNLETSISDQNNLLLRRLHKHDYEGAEQLALSLTTKYPNNQFGWKVLGVLHEKKDRIDKAIRANKKALNLSPQDYEVHNNLGNAFQKSKRLDDARSCYIRAIELNPDAADCYNNLGVTLKKQGRYPDAEAQYIKALIIRPNYSDAHNNLGVVQRKMSRPAEAVASYMKAIACDDRNVDALLNLSAVLQDVTFEEDNNKLQKIINRILKEDTFVRPKDIAPSIVSLLKYSPIIRKYLGETPHKKSLETYQITAAELSTLALLLSLMKVCPVPDVQIESLMTRVRSGLLNSVFDQEFTPECLKFQTALALQCFTNEYIYDETNSERDKLELLEGQINQSFLDGRQPKVQHVLCLASYRPLHEFAWSDQLRSSIEIAEVISRQITEPEKESRLRRKIPALGNISNKVSEIVRGQYERNPYPRWVNLGLNFKPKRIADFFENENIKIVNEDICKVEEPKILIAGCGTGQHSISSAHGFKNSRVLAVDLSLASLAYAKRKTEDLAINNIEYMQADILDLGKLGKQFDIIESVGVLHHMEKPIEGWQVLLSCLKPGGLMKIGLYSDAARQHISTIRTENEVENIDFSVAAMKSVRRRLISSKNPYTTDILKSPDFFSLSTLRDLIFHEQEHRFSINQLKDFIGDLRLVFCGFDDAKLADHFALTFTGAEDLWNLDKWNEYEKIYPNAFAGMYQFWCQKVT